MRRARLRCVLGWKATGSGDVERQILARLDVICNLDIALGALLLFHVLEESRILRSPAKTCRKNEYQVTPRVKQCGRNSCLTFVGQLVGDLKARLAGLERIRQRVVALLRELLGRNRNRLAVRTLRIGTAELRTVR